MSDLLKMTGITKRFLGVLALNNVSLSIRAGEVHALLGENGAGKSTLMKILSGAYTLDEGTIEFDGKVVKISSPRYAQEIGISIIYQELNLVPQMSVAENIFLSNPILKNKAIIDWNEIDKRSREILKRLDVDIDPHARVSSLGIAQQQMIEIAKALNHEAKIIIMDEPSAPLTDNETEKLFETVNQLRSQGVAIIYISHRLEETMAIADRCTIMRDGNTICTMDISQTSIDDIIQKMVGHTLEEQHPARNAVIGDVGLEVKNLNAGELVNNISFSARHGEVLGIFGLVGAGRTETARAIFGIDKKSSGEIIVDGKPATINRPLDAINAGIGFVTEDRKGEGLVLIRDCKENISLASLQKFIHGILLNLKEENEGCEDYSRKLRVKTPSLKQKVLNLSGGNQQKIVLAKWLMRDCSVLILDEPTRGIDVGAKVEVYNIINEITENGKTVVMISSEMTELMGMCDRIVVMCRGNVIGEVQKSEFTQERLMYLAAGGDKFIN